MFAVALMPAQFAWSQLKDQVNLSGSGLKVLSVHGRVLDGQAKVRYRNIESIISWELDAAGLLSLSLPLDFDLASQVGDAEGAISLGLGGADLSVRKLDADLSLLTPALKRERVELSGDLIARNIDVKWSDNRIAAASGKFSWSGGEVSYPVQRKTRQRDFPAFSGDVTTVEGVVNLGIRDAGGSFDVIEGTLDQDGVAFLKVTRKVLDIAQEPWPKNSTEQDVVFKIKKDLF